MRDRAGAHSRPRHRFLNSLRPFGPSLPWNDNTTVSISSPHTFPDEPKDLTGFEQLPDRGHEFVGGHALVEKRIGVHPPELF